jgi:hypothetical protein
VLLLISLFPPFLLAYLFLNVLWPQENFGLFSIVLKFSLAIGVGFGLTSCTFFIWLQLFGTEANNYIVFDMIILLISTITVLSVSRFNFSANNPCQYAERQEKLYWNILVASFSVIFICSLVVFTLRSVNEPHGFWDAWAIWNMRARFLFKSGHYLTNAFSNLYGWSHPDYPLLIPASVARIWSYLGNQSQTAPAAVAMFFTFATVTVAVSSLSIIHSKSIGLFAGVVLLGTPYFTKIGSWQIADVPLGFFILSTIVLFCLHDCIGTNLKLIFISGVMAGFAAWTKNEGILFLATIIITRFIVIFPVNGLKVFLREMCIFIFGLLPILLILVIFKIKYAPNNDLFTGQSVKSIIEKLTNLSRYSTIGKAYFFFFYDKIAKIWLIILPLGLILFRRSWEEINVVSVKTCFFVTIIMISGYFLVFLITPHNISWHIETALPRLFVQLWPVIVFSCFLLLSSPEELMLGNVSSYDSK